MGKLLITGGAGYIGSHAAKYFLKKGFDVVVIDTFERGKTRLAGVTYVELNTADQEGVGLLCKQHRFDAVMHFAAYTSVEESVRYPLLYYRNNTIGTLQFLSVLIQSGVRRFVFSSTSAVYGETTTMVDETAIPNPCNPYGSSKLMVEQFLRRCADDGLLDFVALRYFNAAGADPEGEIGEVHDPETHLIPNILKASLQGKQFQIFGDDYPTPDGTCVRDYIHVWDLIEAHSLALQSLMDGRESAIYNLGTEHGYSIRQVLEEASRIVTGPIHYQVASRRSGDPALLVASSKKIRNELGWKPAFNLTDILTTAYQWEKKQKN
jgi:UDP-glucose 4-epimerase